MTFDQLYKLITEDSIDQFELKGEWGPDAKKRGFDKASIGLLKSPVGVEKIKRLWSKTNYDFDIYFVRSKEGWKYTEVGEVDLAFVRDKLKLDIPINDDNITIIFTNNKGAEKVNFSGWVAAHRFGHALSRNNSEFQRLFRTVDNLIEEIAQKIYGRTTKDNSSYSSYNPPNNKYVRLIKKALVHALGTFKSARDKNLRNPFEFTYELVAQYIVSDKIKFNRDFPKILTTNFAWGHPQGPWSKKLTDEQKEEIDDILSYAENQIYNAIDNLVGAAIGNIYVM